MPPAPIEVVPTAPAPIGADMSPRTDTAQADTPAGPPARRVRIDRLLVPSPPVLLPCSSAASQPLARPAVASPEDEQAMARLGLGVFGVDDPAEAETPSEDPAAIAGDASRPHDDAACNLSVLHDA